VTTETCCTNLILFPQVSWSENVKRCFNLDMTPLRLDSAEVLTALNSFANCTLLKCVCVPFIINLTASKWKGPLNYWTAGRRSGNTNGTFMWCSLESSTQLNINHSSWQQGQPDNLGGQQNCLHLKILKTVSKTEISDRNCTSKFSFACQVGSYNLIRSICHIIYWQSFNYLLK
jgi:hypothetical protein